jgi:hypothetical protein
VLTSVRVRPIRGGGELDDVVVDTLTGELTATLRPSPATRTSSGDASHVRRGAAVTARLDDGTVTAVVVDGRSVASTANPVAQQSDVQSYGALTLITGLMWGVFLLLPGRRRAPGGDARPR